MQRVFVYGTLKRGFPNHYLLQSQENGVSRFVNVGSTVEKFPMVIDKKCGIPFLLDSTGSGKNADGEVFDVDERMLKRLDELEKHPEWFTRRMIDISVKSEEEGSPIVTKCWTYLLQNFNPLMANYEHFSKYERGKYVRPQDRPSDFNFSEFKSQ